MKPFNIVNKPIMLRGAWFTSGVAYGKKDVTYGKRVVYTKSHERAKNNVGGHLTHSVSGDIITKHDACRENLIWACDDFHADLVRGHLHYYVWIYDEKRDAWNLVHTSSSGRYYQLAEWLSQEFERANLKAKSATERIKPNVDVKRDVPCQQRLAIPYDTCFRPKSAYVLSKNVITEDSHKWVSYK